MPTSNTIPATLARYCGQFRDGVADVVYGSRFLGTHRSFMLHHYVGNKLLTLITNVLYNNILTDMETGYKAFARRSSKMCASAAIGSILSRRLPPRC